MHFSILFKFFLVDKAAITKYLFRKCKLQFINSRSFFFHPNIVKRNNTRGIQEHNLEENIGIFDISVNINTLLYLYRYISLCHWMTNQ